MEFAAAAKAQRVRKLEHSPQMVRNLRLLLVDDDPAVLGSTAVVLKLNGHAITTADKRESLCCARRTKRASPSMR